MGKIRLTGATSGYTELKAAEAAGNNTITLPTTSGGEVIVSDSSGNVNIDSGTFYVDASNNRVGIGTSAPGATLDVAPDANRNLQVQGKSGTTYGLEIKNGTANSAGEFHVTAASSGAVVVNRGTTEIARFNSTGLGIGTTTVSRPLVVFNDSVAALSLNNTTTGTAGSDGFQVQLVGSDGYVFNYENAPIIFGTNSTERARLDSSGRLLVGTSTDLANYDVQIANANGDGFLSMLSYSSTASYGVYVTLNHSKSGVLGTHTLVANNDMLGTFRFRGSDGSSFVDSAAITAEVDGTPGANDMPGRLVFSTTADGASSPTERMRITNGGWLKASNTGTYTYAQSSHEMRSNNNDFVFTATNSNASPVGIQIYHITDANGTGNEFLYCYAGSTLRASIRSNGGLANFSANNANLSDRNAKKDISLAADTWDCIKQWEIVNYRYKDQPDDSDLNLGVIAQQVAESCPEVITVFEEAKDDQPEKLGVKEQQMYWMAIKALQEAQVRIEALEAEVAALKAQ